MYENNRERSEPQLTVQVLGDWIETVLAQMTPTMRGTIICTMGPQVSVPLALAEKYLIDTLRALGVWPALGTFDDEPRPDDSVSN